METFNAYFTALASDQPTPGGGSAATIVASCGSALVAMVARICAGNPKYAPQHDVAQRIAADADALRERLEGARIADESAFNAVVSATKLPRDTEAQKSARTQTLQHALRQAAQEPLEGAALALDVLRLAHDVLEIRNPNLISDVGCAAEFADSAVRAFAYNVRINHRFMHDREIISAQERDLASIETQAATLLTTIRERAAS